MKKLLDIFESEVVPVFLKFANNDIMQAISRGFIIASPLSIAGAFFQVLYSLPLGARYSAWLSSSGLGEILNLPLGVTSNIIALLIAFTVAYSYVQLKDKSASPITAAIISASAFLLIVPFQTIFKIEDASHVVNGVIPVSSLGAQGIFVAIFVALVSSSIFLFAIKKNWTIKMPEGVPSNVSAAFSSLIPGILIIVLFMIIRVGVAETSFGTVHNLVFGLLQAPLSGLTNNVWSFLIAMFLIQLLWMVGIHGPVVVFSVLAPMWTAAQIENVSAVTAGLQAPNTISTAFYVMLNSFGGSGMTLALVLLMLKANSSQLRTLGKLSIAPAIFNINEPVIFGIPIVMNPILAIPFTFIPVIISGLAYVLTKVGFLGNVALSGPTQIPIIVKAFMLGGDTMIQWAIFHVVAFIITAVLWYPFFKMLDKQLYAEETKIIEEN